MLLHISEKLELTFKNTLIRCCYDTETVDNGQSLLKGGSLLFRGAVQRHLDRSAQKMLTAVREKNEYRHPEEKKSDGRNRKCKQTYQC